MNIKIYDLVLSDHKINYEIKLFYLIYLEVARIGVKFAFASLAVLGYGDTRIVFGYFIPCRWATKI